MPGEIYKIPTGLATALPHGMYLRIAPQSSMALNHITVEGGVVNFDYRGENKILLKNNGTKSQTILEGQHVAQFIFERNSIPFLQICDSLSPTQRNEGGFRSTNVPIQKCITSF